MAEIQSKKELFLDDEKNNSLLSLNVDAVFYPKNIELADDEDGDAGGITLSVEQLSAYLQAAFNKERRQRNDGQRKFAVCPLSEDPNNLLGKKNSGSCGFGESPQFHPLLSGTQQFSGIDDKLSPVPAENSEASKQFPEKRLENQLRLQKNLGLSASKSVTLAR